VTLSSPPIVRVRWRDAWADHDEVEAGNFDEATEVETVGFLVRETEELISIAAEVIRRNGQVRYRCTSHIPRAMLVGPPEVLDGVPRPARERSDRTRRRG